MEIQGKILEGKSYKVRTTDKGHQEVKFCIKDKDTYHNFKTYLEKGMDVPAYLKPDQKVKIDIEGAKESKWDWNGKEYSDLTVHLSMIRSAKTEAEEVGFGAEGAPPALPFDWEASFEKYKLLMGVYKPTQAGDLKEIMKAAGFSV